MTGLGESLYKKAYAEGCDKTAINLIRKNYFRSHDKDIALKDLQEELSLSPEQAQELFEKEIEIVEKISRD